MLYLDGYAPQLATLKKIASALDTSVPWLLDGDPAPGSAATPAARAGADDTALRILALLRPLPRARQHAIWQRLHQMAADACQETHEPDAP